MDPAVAKKFADRAAKRVSVQTYPANPAAQAGKSPIEIKLERHAREGKEQGAEAEEKPAHVQKATEAVEKGLDELEARNKPAEPGTKPRHR